MIEKLEQVIDLGIEFLRALETVAEKFGFEIKGDQVFGSSQAYTIERDDAYHHEEGYGGNSRYDFLVKQRDQTLLEVRNHLAWDTYSDDSEDHVIGKKQQVILHSDDAFARAVFEAIKKSQLHYENGT